MIGDGAPLVANKKKEEHFVFLKRKTKQTNPNREANRSTSPEVKSTTAVGFYKISYSGGQGHNARAVPSRYA